VVQASVRNVGTYDSDGNGKATSGNPVRAKVQMRSIGTEQSVVVMRPSNEGRTKGLHYPVLKISQPAMGGANGQNEVV
jgi:hypothetical protein